MTPTVARPSEVPVVGERELLDRLLSGDEGAFETLVALLHPPMLRFVRTFISRADVAEEVVQETWLTVLRGLQGFEGRSSLKTWIFHILANRARTRATRDARVIPFADLLSADDESGDAVLESRFTPDGRWTEPPARWQVNTPEALLLRAEVMAQLETALETLPPAQRMVVTLRDVEGLSSDEVCSVLGISESNQRVLLHRGRTRLRRDLAVALER